MSDERFTGQYSPTAFFQAARVQLPPHVPRPPSLYYLQALAAAIVYLLRFERSTQAWLASSIASESQYKSKNFTTDNVFQ